MNITKRISLQNIRKNWKASLLTIISISLSVAMTTMVVATAWGLYEGYKEDTISDSPQWNVVFTNVKDVEIVLTSLGDHVESYSIVDESQFFSSDDNSTTHTVTALDFNTQSLLISPKNQKKASKLNSFLNQGHLPEHPGEIIISESTHFSEALNIGDKVRLFDGFNSTELNETVPTHNGEIVGIFNDNMRDISRASILTQVDNTKDSLSLYIKFKPGTKNIEKLVGQVPLNYLSERLTFDSSIPAYNENINSLLGMQKNVSSSQLTYISVTLSFVIILSFATFSLISNTYYNNIQKQINDFGLLRSIGATKKQIKSMIRFEGYMLLLAGFSLGIGIGYGFSALLLNMINNLISLSNGQYFGFESITFRPYLPGKGIIFSFILSMILVSIPLNHAIRKLFNMTSLEAIRENKRYKSHQIRFSASNIPYCLAKQYHHSDDTKFKGLKFSLIIVIAIFITSMTFIKIGFSNVDNYKTSRYNLVIDPKTYNITNYDNFLSFKDDLQSSLSNDSHIMNSLYVYTLSPDFQIPNSELYSYSDNIPSNFKIHSSVNIWFVDDLDFSNLTKELAVDNTTANTILINNVHLYNGTNSYEGPLLNIKDSQSIEVGLSSDSIITDEDNFFKTYGSIPIDKVVYKAMDNFSVNNMTLIINDDKTEFRNQIFDADYEFLSKGMTVYIETTDSNHTATLIDSSNYHIRNKDIDEAVPKLIEKSLTRVLLSIMSFVIIVSLLNVANLSLTNLNNRKRELASLRSIGMTKKQIKKMLSYENVLIIHKPLIWGTLLGVLCSYLIILMINWFDGKQSVVFSVDLNAILISWLVLLFLIVVNSLLTILKYESNSIIDDMRNL